MAAMIEVHALSRDYGSFRALKGVSFSVGQGEIVGFLGPNGAGKTTCMKLLTGFVTPTSGRAIVAGLDVVADSLEVRRKLGYLPEAAPVYAEMQVYDYLAFIGRVRGLDAAGRTRAIERVAEECDITDRLYQAIGTLSKGYKQRVGLAQALLHQPPILILDEPTSGLDPNQILAIRNLIRRIGESRTVILSTHILQEVQATCDRVLILNHGEIVADATTAQLQAQQVGGALLKVTYAPGTVRLDPARLADKLGSVVGVQRVSRQQADGDEQAFEILADRDVRGELFQVAVDNGLRILELQRERSTLEEVFRRLTQSEQERAAAAG